MVSSVLSRYKAYFRRFLGDPVQMILWSLQLPTWHLHLCWWCKTGIDFRQAFAFRYFMTCADWGLDCSWIYSHFESSYISGIPHSPSRLFYSFFLGWFVSKAKDSIIVFGIWWSAPQLCPWVTRCLQVGCLGIKDFIRSWLHFDSQVYICVPLGSQYACINL